MPAAARGACVHESKSPVSCGVRVECSATHLNLCIRVYVCVFAPPHVCVCVRCCRAQDKISRLADNVYLLRSGSASDTQAIVSIVRHMIHQCSVEEDKPGYIDVRRAATLAMKVAYQNKDMLSAGMIIAGWDEKEGASVYALPMGGTLLPCPFTIGGSGSAYIYGWCDQNFKENMTRYDAHCAYRFRQRVLVDDALLPSHSRQ